MPNIRELREEAGLTQASLGERLGVSRQMVQFLESRERRVSATQALELRRIFELSDEALVELLEYHADTKEG